MLIYANLTINLLNVKKARLDPKSLFHLEEVLLLQRKVVQQEEVSHGIQSHGLGRLKFKGDTFLKLSDV